MLMNVQLVLLTVLPMLPVQTQMVDLLVHATVDILVMVSHVPVRIYAKITIIVSVDCYWTV